MKRMALMLIVLVGVLLAPTRAFAQVSCSRDGLQRAVDLYIAAQTMSWCSASSAPEAPTAVAARPTLTSSAWRMASCATCIR